MKLRVLTKVALAIVFGALMGVIIPNNDSPAAIEAREEVAPIEPTFLPVINKPDVYQLLETFDGDPPHPQRWQPNNWDVTVHSRDRGTWINMDPMAAAHGPNCEPPPATHDISALADAVYICKNHVMTAINAKGYGLIYLTPNYMVDFSEGAARIQFDMSTLRASGRDWIDLWITPYADNLQLALQVIFPDLSGEPRNSVHIFMDFNSSVFRGEILRNFVVENVPGTEASWQGYESFLTPEARRRDTFELIISETSLKFGMPDYNFWWIDTNIAPLGWKRGVVQFGHHSYSPDKHCAGCGPNTWHWDNVRIEPAMPFTILNADRDYVNGDTPTAVSFPSGAPPDAHLRFAGIGDNLEVSFDNGRTWQPAELQASHGDAADEIFKSYWMPIPAGVSVVNFRGDSWWGGDWHVRDITIWSRFWQNSD